MFYTLHRVVKWFFILLALGTLAWLYTQREALDPVWVWYDVYENGGLQRTEPVPTMQGEGTAVLDGHTFQIKSGGRIYSVRLTGFALPVPPLAPAELNLEKQRREVLRKMVLDKPVQVQVTYSNQNSLLGIVRAGSTNLNTFFVARGLGEFNRAFVKSAPRDIQYSFFAASRAHEKRHLLALKAE